MTPCADRIRFMDSEIGVRNLADTFRYNALPHIVHALGMTKGRLNDDVEGFEDLAEYEKLAMLSKAQAELNYAVHWSFLDNNVSMTDSMTASIKWCQYDDDFRRKNGFRLPADPYWLAPPQGSIVPLWHRGGAPNYQPKPMICKHVQDPVKAWRRERSCPDFAPKTHQLSKIGFQIQKLEPFSTRIKNEVDRKKYSVLGRPLYANTQETVCPQQIPSRSIAIYFCSAGTVAQRLAAKLHRWIQRLVRDISTISLKPHVEPLNCLNDLSFTANHILLLIVSSTGHGEIPSNGTTFADFCGRSLQTSCSTTRSAFRFAVFGNGDSRYSSTFNGAAIKVNHLVKRIGGIPLAGGLWNGDTAVNAFPVPAMRTWLSRLECFLTEEAAQWIQEPGTTTITKNQLASSVIVSIKPIEDSTLQQDEYHQQLLSSLKDALVISTTPTASKKHRRSLLLDLGVGGDLWDEMCCIQILPLNAPSKALSVLLALGVKGSTITNISLEGESPNYLKFLTEFVDLELPFTKLDWLGTMDFIGHEGLSQETLSRLSALDVLECLHAQAPSLLATIDDDTRGRICLDMPLLTTRTYSIATSHTYISRLKPLIKSPLKFNERRLSIMIKTIPTGRFSTTFLNDNSPLPATVKYRIVDSLCGPQLRENHLAPFVIVATGAGFGPVRALLQWRIAAAVMAGRTSPPLKRGVSLFLGLKECDLDLTVDVLNEALALDLIDLLDVVVSNPEKRRVYDEISGHAGLVREKLVRKRGMVFVCTNRDAAVGTKRVVQQVLGGDENMRRLGERYLEEVF